MLNDKTVIALIPARGGSKGLPYKNIKMLHGKPLIAWTIEAAKNVPEIDRIVVSTEDEEIKKVCQKLSVEILHRPPELAKDDTMPIDVVKHTIASLQLAAEPDTVIVYLQPTSPLRTEEDIVRCLHLLADEKKNFASVATVCEAFVHPQRVWKFADDKLIPYMEGSDPWLMRQSLAVVYQLNGAVYAFYAKNVKEDMNHFLTEPIGAVLMPKERSIDIDDSIDFMLAEMLFQLKEGKE